MENALVIVVIVLAVLVICILVLLGILFYNQMLVTNEVNKRLLVLTKDTIEHDRSTNEQLQEAVIELERVSAEQHNTTSTADTNPSVPDNDEPFSPHFAGEVPYEEK